jgi:hypothetical protein
VTTHSQEFREFDRDEFRNGPRILFIGEATSSHAREWMGLLQETNFNVRFFTLPSRDTGTPPDDLNVKTYVSEPSYAKISATRMPFAARCSRAARDMTVLSRLALPFAQKKEELSGSQGAEAWLAEIFRGWLPHIVHAFGIYPSGLFFHVARHAFNAKAFGRWVLQTRGGSDLQLRRYDPVLAEEIRHIASEPAAILTDNLTSARYLEELGVDRALIADICPVPGGGGVEVEKIARGTTATSQRRIIVWPKSYEVAWSKALPVLEALRLVWHRLPPCRIVMFAAVQAEVRQWLLTLPKELQEACELHNFVPRSEVLEAMRQARLMLAPSLVDGRPNSMFEAMAAGAIPVVSPVESIGEVVRHGHNVFFARNLYINEIADALLTGMHNDTLVDTMAQNNLALVRDIADRSKVRAKVVSFYRSLLADL